MTKTERVAKISLELEYYIDDDEHIKTVLANGHELTKSMLEDYFLEKGVDEIIDMRFSDIRPALEIDIIEREW